MLAKSNRTIVRARQCTDLGVTTYIDGSLPTGPLPKNLQRALEEDSKRIAKFKQLLKGEGSASESLRS